MYNIYMYIHLCDSRIRGLNYFSGTSFLERRPSLVLDKIFIKEILYPKHNKYSYYVFFSRLSARYHWIFRNINKQTAY